MGADCALLWQQRKCQIFCLNNIIAQAEESLRQLPGLSFTPDLVLILDAYLWLHELFVAPLTFSNCSKRATRKNVLAGQPRKGIEYLEKAEKELDRDFSRNYCRLLFQQSEAFLAAREVDTCVARAVEGLQIARSLGSSGNINWAGEIYNKLLVSGWKNEPVVGKLGAAIVAR